MFISGRARRERAQHRASLESRTVTCREPSTLTDRFSLPVGFPLLVHVTRDQPHLFVVVTVQTGGDRTDNTGDDTATTVHRMADSFIGKWQVDLASTAGLDEFGAAIGKYTLTNALIKFYACV